ncbi:MAG: glycosyltransferase family 2 protein [Lachnospiraceae bacterium]|nr:glycosyltransferase family 2 protein [Lachnospiraceae bacterium]
MSDLPDKITVVIPNYNGLSELDGCVKSVLQELPLSSVIVVDDGSTDNSVSYIKSAFPGIRVISYEENRGFAHAVNAGIQEVKTPYVFLLNNDARVMNGAMQTLCDTMEELGEEVFSVGARMLTLTKPRKIDNSGDLYCALGWAFTPGKDRPAGWYRRRAWVTSVCAGAGLYRTDLLRGLGGFDEAHFCYLEDVDLGIRARLRGYRNCYEPAATVLHAGSATSGSRHNAFKVRLTAGNNLYLLYKNFPLPLLLVWLPLLAAGVIIKGVFFARKGLAEAYLTGLREGLHKIARGGDRRVRFETDRERKALLTLAAEMYLNLIRRIVG